MPAIAKLLIKGLILVLLLLVLGIAALLIFVDPNHYRSTIEQQAKRHAGINLKIDGDINWSLLPIGLNLKQLRLLDQDLAPFSSFEQLILQIDTLSLFRLQPQVHKIVLDRLDIELKKDAQGQANWDRLLAPKDETAEPPASGDQEQEQEASTDAADKSTGQLSFLVSQFVLSNARLHYVDAQNNQDIELSELGLSMEEITLGQAFPLKLSYRAATSAPQLEVEQQLNGQLTIAEDFSQIELTGLDSTIKLSGGPLHGKTLDAQLGGELLIKPKIGQIMLSNVELRAANVQSHLQLAVTNYQTQPELKGEIRIDDFSLPELLEKLGQSAIPTSDPKALSQLSLSSAIELKNDVLTLPSLAIKVDQANWQGKLQLGLTSQALNAELKGDTFEVDGYLPPADARSTQATAEAPTSGDEPLLPLATLRDLNLAITIQQAALITRGIRAEDLIIRISAKDGLLTLQQASTKLFDGKIDTSASINAKTDDVKWAFNGQLDNLNILEQLGQKEFLARQLGGTGRVNLSTQFTSTGNTVNQLKQAAKAETQFKVTDGAITGINLNKLACEGFALLNREQVTKTDWPNATAFNAFEGQISVDGPVINSKQLTIENIGLRASGSGTVNLAQNQLDYELELTPVGELGDEACRVRDKVKGIAIPIKCAGALDASPVSLCGLDQQKLGKLIVQLGGQELEKKAEKEIDKLVDKKLEKYLGEEAGQVGEQLKDTLKGWLK